MYKYKKKSKQLEQKTLEPNVIFQVSQQAQFVKADKRRKK